MKRASALLSIALLVGAVAHSQSTGFGGDPFNGGVNMEKILILKDMALMKLDGLIPMRFANALDGRPISGGKVDIPGIGVFTTDNRGIISFPQRADGTFTMTFTKAGYIPTSIPFRIQASTVINDWYSISPGLEGDFRFVLDWGENPADLDIHLEKEGGYHISYWNMRTLADGSAKLDRDDKSGYGPETITIARSESSGRYSVYIIDYTNRSKPDSAALNRSGATIRVYHNNQLLDSFSVPTEGLGARWNVCEIVKNQIVPIGTIQH
jgi:hypothetical protein